MNGAKAGSGLTRGILAALLVALSVPCFVAAEDWPTYQHDNARSGVTSERLRLPLAEDWTFRARHKPQPAWEDPSPKPTGGFYGHVELRRVHFDDACHVAVVGDSLFFGSSADNQVKALDAATGRVRWAFFTGGPVRLAPTVWKDRVLVGSDDGFVYCLGAADGALAWKLRAAPGERKVLGSGRMVSLWPVRTGVLVDGGIAYFAAGIFPAEGVALYAARADDGTLVWKNDAATEDPRSGLSPQGYLLASATKLFAPLGRVSPAAFDRKDGKLLYVSNFGHTVGGAQALLADDLLFNGTEEITAATQDPPTRRLAWFQGRRLVVTKTLAYLVTDRELVAIDRKAYFPGSLARQSLLTKRLERTPSLNRARSSRQKAETTLKETQARLEAFDQQLAETLLTAHLAEAAVAAAKAHWGELTKKLAADTRALAAAQQAVANLEKELAKLNDDLKKSDAAVQSAVPWRSPCDGSEAMIMARDVLFVGGQDNVAAYDAATGRRVWQAKVDGKARGLAAANGRLFVSTDRGVIHCFGKGSAGAPQPVTEPTSPAPYPKDELTQVYEAAAERILEKTGIRRGFCLVFGAERGRLAFELAKRSDLMIYAVEPDAAKAADARKALDAAGLLGARVCVDECPLGRVPYANYFANLIVSDAALVGRELPAEAPEMFRMLRPLGGIACVPPLTKPLPPLAAWCKLATEDDGNPVVEVADGWTYVTRGTLRGAGAWTHQHAEPGNTACSDEQRVKCPLGVLWFGGPGPGKMLERHVRAASPLALGGRLFVQGENVLMAYDAYNGLKLWEREIKGAQRAGVSDEASNFAANGDSLFVAASDTCLRLDQATGETKATYEFPALPAAPPAPPAKYGPAPKPPRWGYVAAVNGLLLGTRAKAAKEADCLFAVDLRTGARKWLYEGKKINQITITVGDGKVFFADGLVTPDEKAAAVQERQEQVARLTGDALRKAQDALKAAEVRRVVCLDAATGAKRWERCLDLTGCRHRTLGGGELIAMYRSGVLVFCASSGDGHFWEQFFRGEFALRRIVALSAENGSTLWDKPAGYRIRPVIVGETLIAEPWAFDLRTGEQKLRTHPITSEKAPWQYARPGHHCGAVSACPSTLFFRSWTIAWYDLLGDCGTTHFGAQRPGCWINIIPACGLVLVPEASSGCLCAFPNMCTVVLEPRPENPAWAFYSVPGSPTPVRHLALNFGAPGDRRDADGTLWLGYPRPTGSLVFPLKVETRFLPKGGYYRENAHGAGIQGTDRPWVFASGCRGITRCVVPMVGQDDSPGVYTVRLGFIEPDNAKPGQRVFDVRIQGRTVLKDFDLVAAAGGRNVAVVREFGGIQAHRDLAIELIPRGKDLAPERVPLLNSLEVLRTKDLRLRLLAPTFVTSDLRPRDTRDAILVSHCDEEIVGEFLVARRADSEAGVQARSDLKEFRLPPKGRLSIPISITVARGVKAGEHPVPLQVVAGGKLIEAEADAAVQHLGSKRQIVLPAVADAYVKKQTPQKNYGADTQLWADGGEKEMGDVSHCIPYFKFRLDVPGRPISAKLRLPVGTWTEAQSEDSGVLRLVEGEWQEDTLTYESRPKLGQVLAKIGKVRAGEVVERKLALPLEDRGEISIAVDPTGLDGCGYCSRESSTPAELVIEFGP